MWASAASANGPSAGDEYVEDLGSLAMLQEILGHSSLKMVMRYAKPTENAVQEDAERVFLSRVCSKTCSKSGEAFGSQP